VLYRPGDAFDGSGWVSSVVASGGTAVEQHHRKRNDDRRAGDPAH
jgi:hypothetical protein